MNEGILAVRPATAASWDDLALHVGTVATFVDAGLLEVGRPTLRRVVMRVDF